MSLVVFLRGVNVGGHRTLRPARLAESLRHLGAVNIGAAGTFVIHRPCTRKLLRTELVRRLPFETAIAICEGRDILKLVSSAKVGDGPRRRDLVRFVSILSGRPRQVPPMPMSLPSRTGWLVKIVRKDGPFVIGLYRRRMKAIGSLRELDRLFGVAMTTRGWDTMTCIVKVIRQRSLKGVP